MVYDIDEFPEIDIPHKCNIWSWCVLDEHYKLLFCVICHKVIGYDKDGVRVIKKITIPNHIEYEQKEYSDDVVKESV